MMEDLEEPLGSEEADYEDAEVDDQLAMKMLDNKGLVFNKVTL